MNFNKHENFTNKASIANEQNELTYLATVEIKLRQTFSLFENENKNNQKVKRQIRLLTIFETKEMTADRCDYKLKFD